MKKNLSLLLISLVAMIGLYGCSETQDNKKGGSETQISTEAEVSDSNESEEIVNESNEDVTLPDGFPADFPLPENINITKVDEEESEDQFTYKIRFTFDPNMDMDATFHMYDEFANSLDYTIIIGGEEYFADGIFQFGATSKQSASNMFVVTLQPEGATSGDIQVRVKK